MSTIDDNANPYQSPAVGSGVQSDANFREGDLRRPRPWRIFLKWVLVCGISAAPSFILGISIGRGRVAESMGMTTGILLFVVAYTFVECQPFVQQILRGRFVRGTAIAGYITRMMISIIYPLGIVADIWFGLISTEITESVFGSGVFIPEVVAFDEDPVMRSSLVSFVEFLFATVVQGVLLNFVLFAYMLLIYTACWSIATIREPGPAKESDFDRQNL